MFIHSVSIIKNAGQIGINNWCCVIQEIVMRFYQQIATCIMQKKIYQDHDKDFKLIFNSA